jgi:hypothetical protein
MKAEYCRMKADMLTIFWGLSLRKHSRLLSTDRTERPSFSYKNFIQKKRTSCNKLQQTCSNAVSTTCQQDVFALLVPSLLTSCLVDNLLQGCWAQQTYHKLFQQLVIVLQFNNLSTSCEWQICSNLINNSIITTFWQACYKPVANTSCWQVVRFFRPYFPTIHTIHNIQYTTACSPIYFKVSRRQKYHAVIPNKIVRGKKLP